MSTADFFQSHESALLRPGTSDETRSQLIAADFEEIGSSGRTYDKARILAFLRSLSPDAITQIADLKVAMLAPDIALVTYASRRQSPSPPAAALRSSLWIFRDSRWQLRFHQGTPAA